jgi:hypothetical protein
MSAFSKRTLAVLAVALLSAWPGSLAAQASKKKKSAPTRKAAAPAAAPTPAPATPARLELVQVNDRRSSGHFAQLNVHVILPDVPEKDVAAESIVATKAVDDTGKNLVEGAQQSKDLSPTASGMGMGKDPDADAAKPDEKPSPTRLTISLSNPARTATSLKEIAGEIELYVPSRDPNAVFKADHVLSKLGKPLAGPALAASRVEITILTQAQIDAEKKKLADKKRAEMKKDGFSEDSIADIMKSFLENLRPPSEGELVARVKDPDHRIQQLSYVTPSGEQKRIAAMDRDGLTSFSTWGDKPQADWALKVDLRTPKTSVRHTFALADVALP